MARRKNEQTRVDLSAFDQAGARVIDNPITTEVEDSYLEYAYSVIHSRALPDARDGLKPVHRRILWSMSEQGHRPDRPYVKSARVVGDCFARGTLVSTPAGLRPIEAISVGDLVLDPRGRPVAVRAVFENPDSALVQITWTNGHTMTVTPDQRFRAVTDDLNTEWVGATDLVGLSTVGYGRGRHEAIPTGPDDLFAYVRGLIAAEGFAVHRSRSADGRVRIHMCDVEPIDTAHGWAIEKGVNVSRSKRRGQRPGWRDQHVLTFSRHDALLEVAGSRSQSKVVPADVLADRNAWLPFLSGYFDGDGYVRNRNREIVFVSTSRQLLRQVYAMLADLGVAGHYWEQRDRGRGSDLIGLSVSGHDAQTLATALLPSIRVGYKRDGMSAWLDARTRTARSAATIGFPAGWCSKPSRGRTSVADGPGTSMGSPSGPGCRPAAPRSGTAWTGEVFRCRSGSSRCGGPSRTAGSTSCTGSARRSQHDWKTSAGFRT